MEIRSAATAPLATPVAAAAAAEENPPAAAPDQYHAQSLYGWIPPMELSGWKGKDVEHPEKRIDVIKDVLNMDAVWSQGIHGENVAIAVIDTGVCPHPDLEGRIIAFHDTVNGKADPYDDNGHGSHVSGLIAGSGKMAGGRFKGTAYGANIVGVKVLDRIGSGSMANVVKGIKWAIANKDKYNIRVINMSLGGPSNLKEKDDLVALAVKEAYEAGIVPVIAAGNSGPGMETVGSPGNSEFAFTVAAYDDKNTADHKDDTLAFFSSRGPTTRDHRVKPDISSPGVQLVSLRSPGSMIDGENVAHLGDYYVLLSGTSMATPVMAGIVADVIAANPALSVAQVIDCVKSTADVIPNTGPYQGGTGLVNPEKAVAKAKSLLPSAPAAPKPAAAPPAIPAALAPTPQPEAAATK